MTGRVSRDGEVACKRDVDPREPALLAFLKGRSLPVQTLVRLEGTTLFTRWIEGRQKDFTTITKGEWRELGRILAVLHDALLGAPRLPALRAIVDARDVAAERVAIDDVKTDRPDILQYLDDRRALLAYASTPWPANASVGAIHNDYNQFNYLFTDDGIFILDWDRALEAPREYEVVRCLNHLPIVRPDAAHELVDGYLGVRALDRALLSWALDVSLTEHACKRWPLEEWTRDPAEREASLTAMMQMVRALVRDEVTLRRFYA